MTIYKIFNWLKYNKFRSNATKFHFCLSPYQSAESRSSDSQKHLGVTTDSNFTF